MLTVEDYVKIRTGKRDGMSIRVICRTYHHSHHRISHEITTAGTAQQRCSVISASTSSDAPDT